MTPRTDEIRGTLTRDVVSRAMRAGMEHGIDAAIEHLIAALIASTWCLMKAAPRPSGAGAPLDADYAVKLREIAGEIEELTSQGGSVVYAVWGSVLREAADILARPALPATGTALEFEELKRAYDDLSAAYHELLEFHTSGEGAIVMLNGKPVAATGTGAWPTCATCRHYTAGFRGGFCHNWGSRDVPATGFCHEHAPSEPPAPTTARG